MYQPTYYPISTQLHAFSKSDIDSPYQFMISHPSPKPRPYYFVFLGSFSAFNCDNFGKLGKECTTYFKGELGQNWQYGKTFGNIYIGANKVEHYFPSWKPGFWKSFCATGSKRYF